MKTHTKTILTLILLTVLGISLNAIPPGTGSQHIRFTGHEEVLVPPMPADSGWMLLTSKYVLNLPSKGGASIELVFQWTYKEITNPDGSAVMYGAGPILDGLGGNVIGSASFMNNGAYTAFPSPPVQPNVEWYSDGTVVGTIWAGPYAGLVLTGNVDIDASVNVMTNIPNWYESLLDGFLLVSDNVPD